MKSTRIAFAVIAALTLSQPARAFWNDRLEVFADETSTWDSNVFRLSRGQGAPPPSPGESALSDRYSVTSVGAILDAPYSLQRFQADATFFATRYNRFSQLDYNGHRARGAWLWSLTPHVKGDLGASDSKELANFAIFRVTARDLVTAREAHATGTVELTPSWLLYGGYTHAEREHSDPLRRINDVKTDAGEARLSYVTASDNRIGVSVRHEEGKTPEDVVFGSIPFRNDYKQQSVGVVGTWSAGGASRLEGRADYVHRTYEQFSERNYNGPSMRATYVWTPTGKTTLTTAVYREIAPLDDIQTSFVLLTGVSVRPRWDATSKISVQGNLEYAKWDFRNSLPLVPGSTVPSLIPGDYQHRVRTGGVTVSWKPFTRVLFQAGAMRESRTSTLAFADYVVNVFTLEARIGF